ncbi:MAG TPA: PKD domain-containing protein [Actinomycetes bacterium]|nr:PKD domain-containing protein [Actinomycetes bacterium]
MRRVSLVSKMSSVVLAVGTVVAGLALATPSASAGFADTLPSQNPIDYTPRVLNNADNLPNSQARSIAQVGNRIVVGGNFRQIQNAPSNGSVTFSQRALFSFDPATGAIDENFFPNFNGDVTTVLAHPDGNKVYAAGNFSRVNGDPHSRVVLLNINTGNAVSTFDPPAISAEVTSMKLANGLLYIGGDFATIGGTTRRALATLDPVTGALTDHLQSDISGTLHGEGVPSVKAFDITRSGKRLVAIGNFNQVDGQQRVQMAMWDTSTPVATLRNWATQRYGNSCNQVFPTYMRDIDIAPNGKYFVVVTTGSFRFGTLCDTAARWEMKGTGTNRVPNWVNYSGGDTFTSVEVTGPMAYLGGHFRWLNNPYKGDAAGTGAWPTEGLATVDTRNGLPFSWNPGRDRGLGVFDFLPTDSMLWSVSDTNNWAGEFRPRLAGFPLFNNVLPPDQLGKIPGDVWQLGAIPGAGASDQRGIGFDGTTVENQLTEPGDRDWSTVRGAFAVDDTVYTAWSNNTFTAQTWDGSNFGAPQDIDLYEGTSATAGYPNNFFHDLDNITGMFYDRARARIYYTMQGSNQFFWRPFTPESRVVGATRRVLANDGALPPAQVKGMFLAGKQLFFADNTTGALKRVKLAGTKIKGKAIVVNTEIDWRSNALFLSSQWAQLADNVAPIAKLTATCNGLDCTVDASKSSDPDGGIVEYTVDYGDGVVTPGPDAVTEHEYPGTGTFDITVTVKDNRGLTANATTQVSVVQPPNVDPTAAFTFSCFGLDCDFDATTSDDSDGSIVDYDWDFGDTESGTGSAPNHVYDSGGTYDVTLTVTDNRGGTDSVTHQLTANAIPTTVAFRDAVSVDGGGNTGVSIQVPNSVQNGDLMLLFVTNGGERTPDTPANWTALGSRTDDQLRTHVFWRFANANSAGSNVTTTLRDGNGTAAGGAEVTSLVAYSGVASPPVSAWDGRVEPSTSPVTGHATPGITVPDPGAWVVSYWADRTNSGAGSTPTSAWTPPLDQVFRADAFNTGTTPRVSSLLTDDGGPVLAGARSGRTASADVAAEKATMFTIVLASK